MSAKPLSTQEIDDLLHATLHGPLPQETMQRVFATLGCIRELEKQADLLQAALLGVRTGTCWCPFGIGDPRFSTHLPGCIEARTALQPQKEPEEES